NAIDETMADGGPILLGRITFEEWGAYWPTSTDEPFASRLNNTPKYVVSHTLANADAWQNSTLINGDVAAAIQKLKAESDKNISIGGSPTLVRWLLEHDLLDELVLMVHPVVVGKGKRLFPLESALTRLNLLKSSVTPTGVVILTYTRH